MQMFNISFLSWNSCRMSCKCLKSFSCPCYSEGFGERAWTQVVQYKCNINHTEPHYFKNFSWSGYILFILAHFSVEDPLCVKAHIKPKEFVIIISNSQIISVKLSALFVSNVDVLYLTLSNKLLAIKVI